MFDPDDIRAELTVSQGRRVLGVGALGLLGAGSVYLAAVAPGDLGWRAGLLALGLACLWAARGLWQGTRHGVVWTRAGLFERDGTLVAATNNILRVERGAFAFKPSNGFLVVLKTAAPRRWRPGLWWRFGRRVGVGGMTHPAQGKIMADLVMAQVLADQK